MCVGILSVRGFVEDGGGVTALREATSGSMPEPGWLVRRSFLVQDCEEGDPQEAIALRCRRELPSAIPLPVQPVSDDSGAIEKAGTLAAGCAHGQQNPVSGGTAASEATSLRSESHASIDRSLHTPTKPGPAGAVLRSDANGVLPGGGCAPPAVTPTTAFTIAPGQV